MRIVRRVRVDVARLLLAAVIGATGCVESFDGSNVQLDLAGGVQTNTRPGDVSEPDQPPESTHYVLYAADLVYQTNPDGTVVIDASGDPVVDRTYLFEVQEFMVRSVIDLSSPCLIDLEDTRFPGIHVTQYAAALRAETGITDPFAPGQDPDQVVDVLTADRRVANLPLIEGALKAVTSFTDYRYPAIGTACTGQPGADPLLIPPPTCLDAASNAQRLALCKRAWADNPDWYEGSDKVFTLPLSGTFFGMVEGMNPVNQGFVGGSSFFVHQNLVGPEAYLVNWQYDDLDHNGTPDFPASLPMDQRSDTGYPYLRGRPKSVVRGVTTVPMHHLSNPRIAATLAIFPNLGDDSVRF